MDSEMKLARAAGLLYLIVVLSGIFSLRYVPSQINVRGDAAATVANIAGSETLFRQGIVASVICYIAFLLLPFVLYELLGPFGRRAGVLMVTFVALSVPMTLTNLVHKLDVLSLLSGSGFLQTLSGDDLHARMMLSLEAYDNGLLVSQIFWALWLLPFGWLVLKSGFLPRILGILLIAGCFGYLVDTFGFMLSRGYGGTTIAGFARVPGSIGEIGICLWLLIVGARPIGRQGDVARSE